MAREGKGYGIRGEEEERRDASRDSDPRDFTERLSLVDAIHEIAKRNARAPLDSEKQLDLFLRSWWSKTYNRPLKDPILMSYSLEELLYEFYDKVERRKAEEESSEQSDDKIEQERLQENLDWAEQEELRELEELKRKQAEEAKKKEEQDPAEDPENQKWMEEQIQKEIEAGRKLFGEDFGEDINFEG